MFIRFELNWFGFYNIGNVYIINCRMIVINCMMFGKNGWMDVVS